MCNTYDRGIYGIYKRALTACVHTLQQAAVHTTSKLVAVSCGDEEGGGRGGERGGVDGEVEGVAALAAAGTKRREWPWDWRGVQIVPHVAVGWIDVNAFIGERGVRGSAAITQH